MGNYTYKVIMPTSVKYLDITRNFIDLLKINWTEGYRNLVVSTNGQIPKSSFLLKNSIDVLENDASSSLPGCVTHAVSKYPADFYFIFLGDAFIHKKVDNRQVLELLDNLAKDKVQYCRLLPKPHFYSRKNQNRVYRFLNSKERYGHTFTAFVANKEFIKQKLTENISDRDFEVEYLKIANQKSGYYFSNDVVLEKNILQIISSLVLVKGKWNPLVIKRLKKQYPEINFAQRAFISHKHVLLLIFQKVFWLITPQRLRIFVKKKFKGYFDTNI